MTTAFHNDELALLAAIHASPKDDLPRLVWADWLEEHDAPDHAEFVRLQCQQPYVCLTTRDWRQPIGSVDYPFPWDDPTANARLGRMIELFPSVYQSPRYEQQRKLRYYEEHAYGLPIIQVGSHDWSGDFAPPTDDLLAQIGPLPRIDLWVRIEFSTSWLDRQVMQRVDKLHIWPDDGSDDQEEWHEYKDLFWEEMIPLLAVHPLLDRLESLRLCGCESTHTMRLAQRLLEPRVSVEYAY